MISSSAYSEFYASCLCINRKNHKEYIDKRCLLIVKFVQSALAIREDREWKRNLGGEIFQGHNVRGGIWFDSKEKQKERISILEKQREADYQNDE